MKSKLVQEIIFNMEVKCSSNEWFKFKLVAIKCYESAFDVANLYLKDVREKTFPVDGFF